MKYVIIGAGVAGIEAAKTIRNQDPEGQILVISRDTYVHSRCMLHKFISGERDEKGLDFTEKRYNVTWLKGVEAEAICPQEKEILLSNKEKVSYDRLLIAAGADSFIPPVGELRKASNVYGLRNLSDAQAIVQEANDARHVLVIGSGLVGLDAAYGLLELRTGSFRYSWMPMLPESTRSGLKRQASGLCWREKRPGLCVKRTAGSIK